MNKKIIVFSIFVCSRVIFYIYAIFFFECANFKLNNWLMGFFIDIACTYLLYLIIFRRDIVLGINEFFPRNGLIFILTGGLTGWIFVSFVSLGSCYHTLNL